MLGRKKTGNEIEMKKITIDGYDKAEIMKRAWACYRKHGDHMTFGEALAWSWTKAERTATVYLSNGKTEKMSALQANTSYKHLVA